MLFLYACALAQPRRQAGPTVAACNKWEADSAKDVAVVNFVLAHTPSLSPADKKQIIRDIRNHVDPCGNLKEELLEISERVRQVYMKRGYFKTLVDDPELKVIRQNAKQEQIDVTISVEEGQQYRLKDISFTNQKAFTETELRKLMPIDAGDIFDVSKIHQGLENLRKLYGSYGYVNFTPVPDTQIDEDANLISLVIDVDEGELFRWGKLTVNGTESEPGARQKLLKAWQTYEGMPYDGDAALKHLLRGIHAQPEVKPEEVFEASKDEKSHLVNVQLTLLNPSKELKALLNQSRASRARSSAVHH